MCKKAMKDVKEYIERIETDGYCLIPQVFTEEQMSRGLKLITAIYERTKSSYSDRMPFLNKDQPINLQSKDRFFLELLFGSTIIETSSSTSSTIPGSSRFG